MAIVDTLVGTLALRKRNAEGRYLFFCCLSSSFVTIFFLISLLIQNYKVHSIFCSLYFICVDILLNFLLIFTIAFTNRSLDKSRLFLHISQALAIIDCVFLAINPFWEISISYKYADIPLAYYTFDMHWLYYGHLVYTYTLVILVLALLIIKAHCIPREYRGKYTLSAASIIFIVIINALFLYFPIKGVLGRVDLSIATYSIAAILVYACCFIFPKRNYLFAFEDTIFRSLDQGIIIFNYDDELLFSNDKAKNFLSSLIYLKEDLPLSTFLEKLGIRPEEHIGHDSYSLQIYTKSNGSLLSGRCDYKKLRSKNGKDVGHMFVISNAAMEIDILTGFQKWTYFDKLIKDNPELFPSPSAIAACDINALSLLNNAYGIAAGDSAIKDLANALMDNFKSDAYYVRGNEAHLLVISRGLTEADVKERMERIKNSFHYSMQYAVGVSANNNLREALIAAVATMKTRKIMDKESVHSNILTSLINTLQQCDTDTESHVRRTQILGRKFAKRVALSDSQLSQLELLCILHDIGKIGVPLEILNKPGKLTDEEWTIMETHVGKGYKIASSSPDFESIAIMILHHHERWDGNGYPAGLTKESIPLLSRIIAVVDAFDAMVSPRPYKDGIPVSQAKEELLKCAGTQFDPMIVSEFVQMIDEEEEELFKELSSYVAITPANSVKTHNNASPLDGTIDSSSFMLEQSFELNKNVHPLTYTRYILDSRSNIISVDDRFFDLTGYTKEDVDELYLTQNDLIPADERSDYILLVQGQLGQKQQAFIEHRLLRKDGVILNVLCFGRQYFDSASRSLRSEVIVSDASKTHALQAHSLSERQRASIQLKQWEETYRRDSLTSLLCHGAFVEDIESKLLSEGECFALLLLDVNKFKVYNDTFGHRAGDEYLITLANAIIDCVSDKDYAGRMGGDEFSIAMAYNPTDSSADVEAKVAQYYERINSVMMNNFAPYGISMGVAFTNKDCHSFHRLYEIADKALYASKEKDVWQFTFGNKMD